MSALATAMLATRNGFDAIGAVDRLVASLDSQDDVVRTTTLTSLRELATTRDLTRLFAAKLTPQKTRRNLLKAQRYLKDPTWTPVVVKALGDADPGVRAEAGLALAVFGAADAESPLISALCDQERDVRYYAAEALGACTGTAARRAVIERLKVEPDAVVVFALQQAIRRQGK